MLSMMVTTSLAGISLPDGRRRCGRRGGSFFDAGAGAGADVDFECPESTEGKEVLAEPGREQTDGAEGEERGRRR